MIVEGITEEQIVARVAELRRLEAIDREAAAAGADCLRIEVLRHIAEADGSIDAATLAQAAMVTVDEDIGGC